MKSAGNRRAKTSSFSNGKWNCADGIEPESNHASSTGSTRNARRPHSGQSITTSSTYGRCRSSPDRSRPASSARRATEPTHVSWPESHRHTGMGVPQNRSRDSAQSTLFSSQSPKRPCLMLSGCQPIVSFWASSSPLCADVRANHVGLAQ